MKLLTKFLLVIVTSPYFMWLNVLTVHATMPPIVSQEIFVRTVERKPIVGQPAKSNLLELCNGTWRDFKSYMNYEKITSKSSQQYKFISEFMFVGSKDGLLYLETDTRFIGVALGSYFGEIGSKFKFTFDSGEMMYAVKIEEKADVHTIDGCVHSKDSSIIEFVVNSNFKEYYPEAYNAGNVAVLSQFKGYIKEIEIIEGN